MIAKSKTKLKQTEIGLIPENWQVSLLEHISVLVTDGSHFSPKESQEGKRVIATVKDMRYNGFSFKDCKKISNEDFNHLVKDGCSPARGDILISKDGANCLELIFVYNEEREIVVLSSIAIVRLKDEFDPHFYRYYLLSPAAQKIMKTGFVSGSAIPRVIVKNFKKVPVPLVKIETQRAISTILNSLDTKIELNQQMNENLEAIGRAIFRHWFVEFEFPNEEGTPYKSSGGHMVDSECGDIPDGWTVGTLGDIAENTTRITSPKDVSANYPYIGLEHMPRASIALTEWGKASEATSNKYSFKKSEILFGKLRPYFHKVGVAPVDGVCSTDILVVTPKQYQWYGLLLCYVSGSDFIRYTDVTSRGTRMPRTNWADMSRYQIIIPTEWVASSFTKLVSIFVDMILSNIIETKTLTQIRDAILPGLVSGRIQLKDVEQRTAER